LCLAVILVREPVVRAQTIALHGVAQSGARPLANAVIWLEGSNLPPEIPKGKVVLDQRNLVFSPHVLAVRVGTTVVFPNNDRVFHNVFSFRDGKIFDLGLYPVGSVQQVTFDHVGLSRIFCNIHPNMAAYIMVVDSPYFAVTNESGAFTIGSVAAGSYTYRAWRAGGTELTGKWSTSISSLKVDWP
jgi:plastocyanin